MRTEQLPHQQLEAKCLQITILRLLNMDHMPCELHDKDDDYDVYGLVLVLGRNKTKESRQALIELLDFIIPDAVWDAIVTVVEEDPEEYLALLNARIGQPLCLEAKRKKPYVEPMKRQARDKQIQSWLEEREDEQGLDD